MHTTVALNYDTITAAAANHGIMSRAELLQHLGLLTLEPVTVAIIATIHCRLGVPIGDVAQVTRWRIERERVLETG